MTSSETTNPTPASLSGVVERAFAFVALAAFFDVITGLVGYERRAQMQFGPEGDSFLHTIFILIYCVMLVFMIRSWREILHHLARTWPIVIILGVAALSSLWSIDVASTTRRVVALIGTTAFGLYLAQRFGLRGTLELMISVLVVSALLSGAAALIIPDLAIMRGFHEGSWRGVFSHKNELGQTMALGAALLFVLAMQSRRHRLVRIVLAAWCSTLLMLAGSMTGVATLSAMLLAYGAAAVVRVRGLPIGFTGSFVALMALVLAGTLIVQASVILDLSGRDMTLTGRVDLWRIIWEYIDARFWLGYGFGAFWRSGASPAVAVQQLAAWATPSSHNGWLDLWLDLGLVGVIILAGLFVATLSSALTTLRTKDGLTAYGPILILTFLFGTNLAETALLQQNLFPWVIFVAVTVALRSDRSMVDRRPASAIPAPDLRDGFAREDYVG